MAPKLQGKFEDQPSHVIDFMATLSGFSEKADYPKKINGQDVVPMQGVSLKPRLWGVQ